MNDVSLPDTQAIMQRIVDRDAEAGRGNGELPTPIQKPTEAQVVEHLRTGWDGKECLVCDKLAIVCWTDYNGQVYCNRCGATYQVLGSHLRPEWLEKAGMKEKDVARRYCDMFRDVPLARAYWNDTGKWMKWGMWMGRAPVPFDHDAFTMWMCANAARLRPQYDDEWHWEAILATASE